MAYTMRSPLSDCSGRWCRPHARALALVAVAVGLPALAQTAPGTASASSDWGPGYAAAQAADTIAGENGNYWQTVQGTDRGAWWRLDLGRAVRVEAVTIAWARYQDRVHCPPARAVIQVSAEGADGPWTEVRTLESGDLPHDGDAYPSQPPRRYPLGTTVRARCLRLLFPDGAQAGAKYPGYLCLGEVEVESPDLAPRLVTIEGRFGQAELDVAQSRLVRLTLRGPAGLGPQSLLARQSPKPWAQGAYTYVVGPDGSRYETRFQAPAQVETLAGDPGPGVQLLGIPLATPAGDAVATEDWTLAAPGAGAELVWRIRRTWRRDFTAAWAGTPGLFFGFNARQSANSVTSTLWHDPLYLRAQASDLYRLQQMPGRVSENHAVTVRDRDTWAVLKLWTNWHAPCDLRLEVRGGHLYRRGSFAWLSEAGGVTSPAAVTAYRRGQIEEITLKLAPVEKQTTGHQLSVRLPDADTAAALSGFYGSVLNGGAVNDQKGFDFGNESDGWYYAGSCWMYGVALAAGVPGPGQLSARPWTAAQAFRDHLAHVLATLDDEGCAHFGYNQGGEWVDDNLHTILGMHSYLLHTGDLAFARACLPALERMLGYFIQRRDANGLFKLDSVGAHWYYDAIATSGINGYYNAFLFKAASDLAAIEAAAGRNDQASEYRRLADEMRVAFNRVLWREDLPGGPRYLDWIDAKGNAVAYFCDLCQWPPVAVGIATPKQARQIVATADARLAELEREHGYRGTAGLSALWPVPPELNPCAWQTFGVYMNGGSLLCQTYWEIVARARAGDGVGAARRLRLFAQHARDTSWAGDNAANIRGELANGDGEPYLADMVAATAGLIHGVLGINPTWDRLEVTPHLPPDWPWAEADVLYKGRRHHLRIDGDKVRVEPREPAVQPPLVWVMDADLRRTHSGTATCTNTELGDGSAVALKRVYDDAGCLGLWKLDEAAEGPVLDGSPHQAHGSLAGEGIRRGEPGHGPGSKCYRFEGKGSVSVAAADVLASSTDSSFTVQCWFRTEAQDSRVMLGRPNAWCVYVKHGRLAAWLMQDDTQFREALGSRPAADGQWHHVAAVCDRAAQRLCLYLDGTLDTPDANPGPQNPVDISPLAPATTRQPLTIGGLGNSFLFSGWLDEASVFRGAREPAEFALAQDCPTRIGSEAVRFAPTGSYVSPTWSWGQAARLCQLEVAVALHDGGATAVVESSTDGFATARASARLALTEGVAAYPLSMDLGTSETVRLRLELAAGTDASHSPVVDAFRLTAEPAPTGP